MVWSCKKSLISSARVYPRFEDISLFFYFYNNCRIQPTHCTTNSSTECRLQPWTIANGCTTHMQSSAVCRSQTTNHQPPTTVYKPQTAVHNHQLPTTNYSLQTQTTNHQLQFTNTNHKPPAAVHNHQPTTNHSSQSQTTDHSSHTKFDNNQQQWHKPQTAVHMWHTRSMYSQPELGGHRAL
jgi:hypothetical protein